MKDFKRLFVQVVSLPREMGMVGLGRLEIDGTKVRAKASRRKAMSHGRMKERERQLKAEIDELLKQARRKWTAEAPHGWIKEGLGFRRFSLRGLRSVHGEWNLVCLALNIKRMCALMAA